jgi:hypothetical protein
LAVSYGDRLTFKMNWYLFRLHVYRALIASISKCVPVRVTIKSLISFRLSLLHINRNLVVLDWCKHISNQKWAYAVGHVLVFYDHGLYNAVVDMSIYSVVIYDALCFVLLCIVISRA